MIAEAYRGLSAKEKQKYVGMATEDKAVQKKKMEEWEANNESEEESEDADDEERTKAKALKKKKKDATKPKRGKNAYTFFMMEQHPVIKEKHPKATNPEIVSLFILRPHGGFIFATILTSISISLLATLDWTSLPRFDRG